jgi:hypothetical protein
MPRATETALSAARAAPRLQGDRDEVMLEREAAVAVAPGDGWLAVLPGTRGLPAELPAVVNPRLTSFLRGAFAPLTKEDGLNTASPGSYRAEAPRAARFGECPRACPERRGVRTATLHGRSRVGSPSELDRTTVLVA